MLYCPTITNEFLEIVFNILMYFKLDNIKNKVTHVANLHKISVIPTVHLESMCT